MLEVAGGVGGVVLTTESEDIVNPLFLFSD